MHSNHYLLYSPKARRVFTELDICDMYTRIQTRFSRWLAKPLKISELQYKKKFCQIAIVIYPGMRAPHFIRVQRSKQFYRINSSSCELRSVSQHSRTPNLFTVKIFNTPEIPQGLVKQMNCDEPEIPLSSWLKSPVSLRFLLWP